MFVRVCVSLLLSMSSSFYFRTADGYLNNFIWTFCPWKPPCLSKFNFLHIGNKKKDDEQTFEVGTVPGRKKFLRQQISGKFSVFVQSHF
jgi:hypothetical protein